MVQHANARGQITMSAEVNGKRVPLNRADMRDVFDDLLELVLELGFTNAVQALEKRHVDEALDSNLESHLVRSEHQHGKATRRCSSAIEVLAERSQRDHSVTKLLRQ